MYKFQTLFQDARPSEREKLFLHLPQSTVYKRLAHPETITLRELKKFAIVFQIEVSSLICNALSVE